MNDQTSELAMYARELSKGENLSGSTFDAQFCAINSLRDTSTFEVEAFKEARRIAQGIVTTSRKRAIDACDGREGKE